MENFLVYLKLSVILVYSKLSTLVYQLHFRENVETGFLCVGAVGTGTISKKPYSVKWTMSRRIHANYLEGDSS